MPENVAAAPARAGRRNESVVASAELGRMRGTIAATRRPVQFRSAMAAFAAAQGSCARHLARSAKRGEPRTPGRIRLDGVLGSALRAAPRMTGEGFTPARRLTGPSRGA